MKKIQFYLAHFDQSGNPFGKDYLTDSGQLKSNTGDIKILSFSGTVEETEVLQDFSRWL